MKKISCYILVVFLLNACSVTTDVGAQKMSKGEVLKTLLNMKVFVDNRTLKKQAIEQVKIAVRQAHFTEADYFKLNTAYNDLLIAYNRVYLNEIKSDLVDYKQFQILLSNPNGVANRYAAKYGEVVNIYNTEFNPVVNEIINRNSEIDGDVGTLINIGLNLFKKVVNIIKERKLQKEDIVQIVISEINNQFFKKLELPTWESFEATAPDGYTSTPIAASFLKLQPVQNTHIPLPFTNAILETVSGEIQFEVYDNATGNLLSMGFEEGNPAKIEVNDYGQGFSGDQITGKPPSPTNSTGSISTVSKITSNFQTLEKYPKDTYYRIKATGDGLVYIFSVNSDNTMYGFYPQKGTIEEIDSSIDFDLPPDADQITGRPPAPTASNSSTPSTNQVTITIPDKENYIHIIDPAGKPIPEAETLVILFSRSEIDMVEIFDEMESFGDALSPQERLALIFGSQAASTAQANVEAIDGRIDYHLGAADEAILPLVFAIKRK